MVVINLLPFFIHEIYADTLTLSNVNGFQVNLIDTSFVQVHTFTLSGGSLDVNENNFTYNVNVQLDDYYLGYANIRIQGAYYTRNNNGLTTQAFNFVRKVFINGNECNFSILINTISNTEPILRPTDNSSPYITIESSDVTKIADIDSIGQIINILSDLYNSNDQVEGLLNNQLTQLQNIVSAIGLSNQYLDSISKLRQWNIPIESYSWLIYAFYNNFDLYDSNGFLYNYFNYPIFSINQNQTLYEFYSSTNLTFKVILLISANTYNVSTLSNYFSVDDGTFSNIKVINNFTVPTTNYLVTFDISNFENANFRNKFYYTNQYNRYFIPILFVRSDYMNLSTDFALQFGLSNSLLDNIQIIANGTAQSNQSASNLEQSNTTLETSQNQMFNFENQQNQNMNNALNQIDTNFNIGNVFGSSFLASADWVRTQFNLMTAGNAFGSVLSFSLLLGLSLLIIGKVLG